MSKGRVKDVLDPKDVKANGFYKLRGIKKCYSGSLKYSLKILSVLK